MTSNLTRGVDLPSDDPSAAPGEARPTKEPQETGTLNYVLLGSDSRDPENSGAGRSDTIMVVHLNKKRNKAYVVSFPRDMYVEIPGYGKNKINAAYSFGGVPLTVRTLEKLTGTRMDHVVLVDFEGFIALTEDLRGVTVINDDAFSSHGYDYPEGEITIAGEQALWFVRERKQLPNGDLDRAKNQRNVIKAIVRQGHQCPSAVRPGHVHPVHRQRGQAPHRGQQPVRRRDPPHGLVAPAGRRGHQPDAGTDRRLRHRQRAEHRRRRHRQAGRAGQRA